MRSCVAVVSGATALGLAVYRRPRRALAAGGLALTLLAASGGTAYATWNPKSVLEPKFSGLLSRAPSVVGNARSIVTEFDVYQKELARLVTNVTKLYDATSTLPAYQPDPSTIRVLHVSDIHLNPASWKIIASLVEQYKIDVIVDSGDTMDHGTAAENGFLDPIEDLGAPYVWVRGNHDSLTTQRYLEDLKNVHVLDDGKAVTIAGLRFAGIGDPQFTPDRSSGAEGDAGRGTGGRPAGRRPARPAGRPAPRSTSPIAHNPRPPARPTARSRSSSPATSTTSDMEVLQLRHPAAHRGLDRRQRPARRRGQVPRPGPGVGPLPGPRHPPPPGLGRDRTGRPGPDDGGGQPPPPGGEPARREPAPAPRPRARPHPPRKPFWR